MFLKNKKFIRTVQIIFGLYLVFTAIMGLFQLAEAPVFNEAATAFMTALFNTGYFFIFLSLVFLIAGIMFIFNKYTAFAAMIIVPITLNILLFHIFLDFSGFWFALIFILINLYFLKLNCEKYKPLFR